MREMGCRTVKPRVLVISGSMGAGKTTVMGEVSDLLAARGIRHVAIDLDAISLQLVPEPVSSEIQFANLAAAASNCLTAGIDTFVIAAAIESREFLAVLRAALQADAITIARLTADTGTMEARLRVREPGIRLDEFLERSRSLARILSRAALEDFAVANDARNVTDVARELLERAGWS